MDKLAHDWHFTDCKAVVLYFVLGLLSQLVIRAIMSALSAWYLHRTREPAPQWPPLRKPGALELFRCCALGIHPTDGVCRDDSDYSLPLFLGLIEQYSYPIMMAVGAWAPIGAWLGFKTIAHWHRWSVSAVLTPPFMGACDGGEC